MNDLAACLLHCNRLRLWPCRCLQIARLLLARGAEVNATDNGRATAAFYVAHKGNVELLKLLLASGCDVRTENEVGFVRACACFSCEDVCEPQHGNTALAMAVFGACDAATVRYLAQDCRLDPSKEFVRSTPCRLCDVCGVWIVACLRWLRRTCPPAPLSFRCRPLLRKVTELVFAGVGPDSGPDPED